MLYACIIKCLFVYRSFLISPYILDESPYNVFFVSQCMVKLIRVYKERFGDYRELHKDFDKKKFGSVPLNHLVYLIFTLTYLAHLLKTIKKALQSSIW